MRHTPIIVVLATVLVMTVTACGQPSGDTAARQQTPTVKEVVRSRSHAGGQIHISHRLPESLIVEQQATIALRFQLQPFQSLEIAIQDSNDFQLVGDTDVVLAGNESGLLELPVDLVPRRTGRVYLKLIAATVDGEKIRSYAIRLNVADSTGYIPDRQRLPKQRIDLPSTTR